MPRVEPVTQAWADALIEGDDVFAQRFGVPVATDWAGFPDATIRRWVADHPLLSCQRS